MSSIKSPENCPLLQSYRGRWDQESNERLNGRRRCKHDPKKENGGNKKKGKCSRIARTLVK